LELSHKCPFSHPVEKVRMRGDKDSTPPHLNPLPLLGARRNELKTVQLFTKKEIPIHLN